MEGLSAHGWHCCGEYLGKSISGKSCVYSVPDELIVERESELGGESLIVAMFLCESEYSAILS